MALMVALSRIIPLETAISPRHTVPTGSFCALRLSAAIPSFNMTATVALQRAETTTPEDCTTRADATSVLLHDNENECGDTFDAQHVELAIDVTEDEIGPGHLALPVHPAGPNLSRKKSRCTQQNSSGCDSHHRLPVTKRLRVMLPAHISPLGD